MALTGDMTQAWQHQHKVVETVRASYVDYLKRLGVHLYNGTGCFLDPRHIQIQSAAGLAEIHTETSVIATGSVPSLPQGITTVPGKALTSDMLYDDGVPSGDRVIMVGGGVIGTEFAYIFTQLGKQVEWLTHAPPLAHTRYSPQAKDTLKAALAALNIHPQAGFRIARIETTTAGVTVFDDRGSRFRAIGCCSLPGAMPLRRDWDWKTPASPWMIADLYGLIPCWRQRARHLCHWRCGRPDHECQSGPQ
jgi:dihydrolipoamide dehydrogenase (EC 1.8.1.4)